MKYKLTKEAFDALTEEQKPLYKETGDDYTLAVEGLPETGDLDGLKSKVEQLLTEKKDAKRLADANAETARLEKEKAARASGDVEALEASWQVKHDTKVQELQAVIDGQSTSITGMTVDTVATTMANELAVAGSAAVLMPTIKARLAVEQREGKFVTVVKGVDGKASALTIDDLKKEISSDPAFAPVIVGSRASGGGAGGGSGAGGAGDANPWSKDTLNLTEQAKISRENPALAASLKLEA